MLFQILPSLYIYCACVSNISCQWWNCFKQITGKKRVSPNINITRDDVLVPGNDLADHDLLGRHFSSISSDLPPLDPSSLPAFLPAPEPPPFVTSVEVCSKLLKLKPFKSPGPDGIPNCVLLRQYAYELQ